MKVRDVRGGAEGEKKGDSASKVRQKTRHASNDAQSKNGRIFESLVTVNKENNLFVRAGIAIGGLKEGGEEGVGRRIGGEAQGVTDPFKVLLRGDSNAHKNQLSKLYD